MRFLPRSLLGQVMLAMGAALLIAQAISAVLLYRAAEQRRDIGIMHAAAFQLVEGARRDAGERPPPPPPRAERGGHRRNMSIPRLPRALRYMESASNPVAPGEARQTAREDMLRNLMDQQGIEFSDVAVTIRALDRDPQVQAKLASDPELANRMPLPHTRLLIVGVKREGAANWQVTRLPLPPRDELFIPTLILQTLILFVVLVGLMYLVLRRITRPMDALLRSTRRFTISAGAPEPPLTPTGPDDIRRLILAHNAMQARIGSMLDEKDVMLGAIGHDLKTPLAALRVRIEGVEDETQRAKMAATIEDITRTLDEILALARVGRPDSAPERVDIHALAASVVEEFEDMGDPVELADGGRIAASARITWLKRGLRNLVTNALRYAGTAEVAVLREGDEIVLRVDDNGPGIPEDRLAEMTEPFTRGESSRNRETGGAGLGLALARAVAEQHGGTLTLSNRAEGGLRAEIRIPA